MRTRTTPSPIVALALATFTLAACSPDRTAHAPSKLAAPIGLAAR